MTDTPTYFTKAEAKHDVEKEYARMQSKGSPKTEVVAKLVDWDNYNSDALSLADATKFSAIKTKAGF